MTTYSFYIYAASALPYDAGTDSFTFDPNYAPSTGRLELEITDDDAFLDGDEHNDEVGEDANQSGVVRTPDGTQIKSGLIYAEQWGLIRAPDGTEITIDRIEIGGQLVGYSPSQLLQPGVTYQYVTGGDVDNSLASENGADTRLSYAQYQAQSVPCFGPGAMIDTANGLRAVETLRAGDLVLTRDHGMQPVIWASQNVVDLRGPVIPGHRPVRLTGPQGDLVLSGNHRVLTDDPKVSLLFGEDAVLVAAKDLLRAGRASKPAAATRITYTHLLFERHELIRAQGLWVESLLATEDALRTAPPLIRGRLRNPLAATPPRIQTARMCLKPREAAMVLGQDRGMPKVA